MYNCDMCGKAVPAGSRCRKVVVKTKDFKHPYRSRVNAMKIEDRWEWTDDRGGDGVQIAKEIKVCEACEESAKQMATHHGKTKETVSKS